MFRFFRITLALVVFTLSLAFFLDFSSTLSTKFHLLMAVQFVPALLAGAIGVVVVLLLSVLLFGRLYCSVLCPLGILQDGIARLRQWTRNLRYKEKRKRRIKREYTAPLNYVRYGFLAVAFVPLAFGATTMLTLLDPYSNFGRIVTGIAKPLYVWGNNLLAKVATAMGSYALYAVTNHLSVLLTVVALVTLIVLVVMVLRRDRLWCNSVCPVGTLLGLLSRYSLFQLVINTNKCTHCTRCVSSCKSHCINHKKAEIDHSRCVMCYDCIGKCTEGAIAYKINPKLCKKSTPCSVKNTNESTEYAQNNPSASVPTPSKMATASAQKNAPSITAATLRSVSQQAELDYDASRRRFLKSAALSVGSIALVSTAFAAGVTVVKSRRYPMPPGAVPDFSSRCTGCQLCVSKCPMHVLRPSYLENGLKGIMQPHMYFQTHSYCNYECTICSEVCPNGALEHLSVEQKRLRQVGVVEFVKEKCIVYMNDNDCGACAEHCPTQAVKMVPYKDELTIPQIDPSVCIGCGACESICPEQPHAIFIQGSAVQLVANAPKTTEQEEVQVQGFGF